jgi:hypothetical protein
MIFKVEALNKGTVFMNSYGTNWDYTTEKQMATLILIKGETKCAFCEEEALVVGLFCPRPHGLDTLCLVPCCRSCNHSSKFQILKRKTNVVSSRKKLRKTFILGNDGKSMKENSKEVSKEETIAKKIVKKMKLDSDISIPTHNSNIHCLCADCRIKRITCLFKGNLTIKKTEKVDEHL